MNYQYMKVFYTVCKHQNISKAANELDLTQPAVSRIISNIEIEYNMKLFNRSKSGVTLTREGLSLYNMIKTPYTQLEKVDKEWERFPDFHMTTVHVGATSTALYCYFFKYLESIKKDFPTINFHIHTSSSVKLLNMVENDDIDFALITTPFPVNKGIEIDDIHKLNNILIAPISYKDKINGRVSIKSLAGYPFVLLSDDMQFREHIDEYFFKNGIKIIPAYETDSSSLLVSFVENDCGLAFIPEEMAEKSIAEGKCFQVDLIEKMPARYVSFAIKKKKNHPNIIYEIKKEITKKS